MQNPPGPGTLTLKPTQTRYFFSISAALSNISNPLVIRPPLELLLRPLTMDEQLEDFLGPYPVAASTSDRVVDRTRLLRSDVSSASSSSSLASDNRRFRLRGVKVGLDDE